ncbi:hypothetical protein ACJ73_07257, partial [Blastomyces percursus]
MPPPPAPLLKGSCLCSKTSFTSTTYPLRLTHCHCIPCRKLSGGPFTTWADFPSSAITWTPSTTSTSSTTATSATPSTNDAPKTPTSTNNGAPTLRRSSQIATHGFCESCGSTVSMQYDVEPEVLGLAARLIDGDFDQGDAAEVLNGLPQKHIFLREKAG